METLIRTHRDLDIWKKSIVLVKDIYLITGTFPREEKFGIIQQMRRSAVSVPSNISEGAGRRSKKEFIHFLSIAQGSLTELETQLIISKELGYISDTKDIDPQIIAVRQMIKGLMRRLSQGLAG
jgi:four helix bundle protein